MHQAIEKFIKNFEEKKIAEKKNDSETSPLLTESVLVGGAQDSDFLGEERASAPWDASAVPADQLPRLSSVGKLTPPGKMFTETLSQSKFISATRSYNTYSSYTFNFRMFELNTKFLQGNLLAKLFLIIII